MKKRAFKGIWISKEIWISNILTLEEKVFLAEVISLSDENGCIESNEYFAKFFQLSNDKISNIINSLIQKKYIISIIKYKIGTKNIVSRVLKEQNIRNNSEKISTTNLDKKPILKKNPQVLSKAINLSKTPDEYKQKLEEYISNNYRGLSYEDFYNSCIGESASGKVYKYKNYFLAYKNWTKNFNPEDEKRKKQNDFIKKQKEDREFEKEQNNAITTELRTKGLTWLDLLNEDGTMPDE